MATYGDLKDRIRQETVRDDIASGGENESALTRAITQAIEFYQSQRFWFKYGLATADTTAGTPILALPATIRIADEIKNPSGCLLIKVPLRDILTGTETGEPTRYAEYGSSVYLWPTPEAAYTLTFLGVTSVAIPATDNDSNIWTTEAYDLISAHAKFRLYDALWYDRERAAMAQAEAGEAFARLMDETTQRNDTPLRLPTDFPVGGLTFSHLY